MVRQLSAKELHAGSIPAVALKVSGGVCLAARDLA